MTTITTAPAPAPPAIAPAKPEAPIQAPPAAPVAPKAAPPVPETRKFTTAEYHQLAAAGILHHTERVELIAGEIVLMAPIGHLHGCGVDRLALPFTEVSRGRFIVRTQGAVRLGEHYEPEPDIALLAFREDYYAGFQPGPEDILLIAEVGDTTLAYDREVKARAYAAAGIPQMLIMDLNGDCLEDLTDPGPDGYRQRAIYRRGDTLRLVALPDLEFAVSDLLPPRPAAEQNPESDV